MPERGLEMALNGSTMENKKLGRKVDFISQGERAMLYERDGEGWHLIAVVDRPDAHNWFHGYTSPLDPPEIKPGLDEMLEAIAAQLQGEMKVYMEWALDNEDALHAMYNVCKGRSRFDHAQPRLTRASW
jgi:hypothetical protein